MPDKTNDTVYGYTNFPNRVTEGGVIVPHVDPAPEKQTAPPRPRFTYEHGHGVPYEPTKRYSFLDLPVLPFLWGRKWDKFALAFLHAVRPSAIRVIPYGGCEKTDGWSWRVTVHLNEDGTVKDITQECEVSCEGGFEHGWDLACKFKADGGVLE
jgi:hypothetical protein